MSRIKTLINNILCLNLKFEILFLSIIKLSNSIWENWEELINRARRAGEGFASELEGETFKVVVYNVEAEFGGHIFNLLANLTRLAIEQGARKIEVLGIDIVEDRLNRIFRENNTFIGYEVTHFPIVFGFPRVLLRKEI
jgi:hypothetical protein